MGSPYYSIVLGILLLNLVVLIAPVIFYDEIVAFVVENKHSAYIFSISKLYEAYDIQEFSLFGIDPKLVFFVIHYLGYVFFIWIIYSGMLGLVNQIMFSFRAPEDIYHQAMKRYNKGEMRKDTEVKGISRIAVSTSEHGGIKPLFMSTCPICKRTVDDSGIRCDNCYSIYHEEHLRTYLEESNPDYCPVCGFAIFLPE